MRDALTSTTVVVLAPGRGEHLAQQQADALGVDARVGIVGTEQLGPTLDVRPLPPGTEGHAHLWAGTKVRELRLSIGHESDDVGAADRMGEHARVDQRGMDRHVGTHRRDDGQVAILAADVDDIAKCCHGRREPTGLGCAPFATVSRPTPAARPCAGRLRSRDPSG
jgi:hypothetical protein